MQNFALYRSHKGLLTLAAVILAVTTIWAGTGRAGDFGRDDDGLVLGFNAGFGGGLLEYRDGSKSITEDAVGGAMGALRVGYALNSKFMISIEGHGFGQAKDDDEDQWGLGAGFVALTWHPKGGGFFLRGGVGAGGGDYINPDTDELITIEDRLAGLIGIGYDWQLTDSFQLGVALDGFSMGAGRSSGHDDDTVGAGGLTVQCNWRL